jgi:hypothetical protein
VAGGLRVVALLDSGYLASTLVHGTGWAIEDHGSFDEGAATPVIAAESLVAAWLVGDEPAAHEVATNNAVGQLFAIDPGTAWSLVGCELATDGESHRCGFSYEGGFAQLRIDEASLATFEVVSLSFAAD